MNVNLDDLIDILPDDDDPIDASVTLMAARE